MEHKLHRTDRQLACAGAVLEFYRDTMVLPDGQVQTWDYVHHKKGGGACTVPVLPDGRILLIRQFRPAIDREALELPAGARDSSGEDPAVTAARELEEETGYRPGRMTKLAHILTAIAWCNESTDIYLARDLEPVSSQHLDEAEEIELCIMSLDELCSRIFAGEIQDAKTVAGIMAYKSFLAMEEQKNAPLPSASDPLKAADDSAAASASGTSVDSAASGISGSSENGSQKDSGKGPGNDPGNPSGGFQRPDTLLDKLQRIVRRARTG
jgi:ADP-ribose pyrophosphatase